MISIVDDDISVRESTKELVESLGYEAFTFASAEEFLESQRVRDTSCLVTDLQMRGLSGIDLKVGVFLLSSSRRSQTRRRAVTRLTPGQSAS